VWVWVWMWVCVSCNHAPGAPFSFSAQELESMASKQASAWEAIRAKGACDTPPLAAATDSTKTAVPRASLLHVYITHECAQVRRMRASSGSRN